MPLLEVREVTKEFGGLTALRRVNFDVFNSEILGLIGPNGAGKTTAFNVISGFFAPTSGRVFFKGSAISGLRPDQISQMGISRTFQQTNLFMQTSVFDNVFIGFHKHYKQSVWKAFFHTASARKEESILRRKATELLEFMGLNQLKDELAIHLPHGLQRILGVCVAVGCNPELLLLDEPMTGMNPTEKLMMVDLIRRIRDMGVTIVVVEHDMRAVMSLCERIIVLNYGEKIAEGSSDEIKQNVHVIEAYLGKEEE